jgi:hypothetical protein
LPILLPAGIRDAFGLVPLSFFLFCWFFNSRMAVWMALVRDTGFRAKAFLEEGRL